MPLVQTVVEKFGLSKLPFLSGPKPEEDERLMHLFRNRAGLKKAHATLQDDLYELREKLKQQEKGTQRVQEQMEALEVLLGNPEAGYGALVFFQLRGLWRACTQQLEQFTAELERQQEERERQRQLSEFNRAQTESLAAIDERIAQTQAQEDEQIAILTGLEQQRAGLKGFWNYFRRRKLLPRIEQQRGPVQQARNETETIRGERAMVEQRQPPPFPGVSVEGKRSINLAVIAYAMVLGARLSANNLASRAKEAMSRRVNDAQFGARAQCEEIMAHIARSQVVVKARKDSAPLIKACVDQLREVARYRSEVDTVPLTDTLAGVIPNMGDGTTKNSMTLSAPQILADDYWYVYKVLLR